MSTKGRGLRNIGSQRLNAARHPVSIIAARIHRAIQTQAGANRVTVAVLGNGDLVWGRGDRGLLSQVLAEPDGSELIVGTFGRASTLEAIEARLAEHLAA